MYDHSFTERTIRLTLNKSDFLKYPLLTNESNRSEIVDKAIKRACFGFASPLEIEERVVKGRYAYKMKNFHDEIVLRKASKNIKTIKKIKQQDRDSIVNNLKNFLREGVGYRVYRFDIKDFYESMDSNALVEKLSGDVDISNPTFRVIKTLFEGFRSAGVNGLPRGLSISATLAELSMMNFDQYLKNCVDVFFYSRYVDDIIIVSSGNETEQSIVSKVKSKLPFGLVLNEKKKHIEKIGEVNKIEKHYRPFDYLGYQFQVSNIPIKKLNKNERHKVVEVDISKSKVKKLKSRMVKSIAYYCADRDYNLLLKRLKLIAGNYSVLDRNRDKKIKVGIFYNYKHVSVAGGSKSIGELDRFLRKSVLSNRGRCFSQFGSLLTKKQKKEVLKITFKNGFDNRVFYHFSPTALSSLKESWVYE